MIHKPDDVRVIERPRTRIDMRVANPSPAVTSPHRPAENQNLPQGGWVGRWVGKSHVLGHENNSGHETPARRKERKEVVIAWMVTHGITNRAAVFAGCPEVNRSASLHHAAISVLLKSGLIERVWREYVFCVEEKDASAWLAQRKSRLNFG